MQVFLTLFILLLSCQASTATINDHESKTTKNKIVEPHSLTRRRFKLKGANNNNNNNNNNNRRVLKKGEGDDDDDDEESLLGGLLGVEDLEGLENVEELLEGFCFSPKSEVKVLGRGRVAIENVGSGDQVLTASGEYKTIFAMDHFHPSERTKFVQIYADLKDEKPLEVTPNHLIFTEGMAYPVPASYIKVGDQVKSIQGIHKVTKVEHIQRDGFYNPITSDGTIVVDGIVASAYASFSGKPTIEIAGFDLLSIHSAANMAFAPYRAFCMGVSLEFCKQHEEKFGASPARTYLQNFVFQQNNFIKSCFLAVYLASFGLIHLALKYHMLLSILVASFFCLKNAKNRKTATV